MPELINLVEGKRDKEIDIVSEMIVVYCRKKHHTKGGLCEDCRELLEYAKQRSSKCPFMEEKTFCSNCKVHCYKPDMRAKIREVMRFCGPWMLLHHPILSIKHIVAEIKNKRMEKKND